MLTGGCACGTVRYRLTEQPYDTGYCHCRICQRLSGSDRMVFTTVPRDAYVVETGADRIGRFASTDFGERSFCGDCGTPLTIHVAHQDDEIDVTGGSLDDPAVVEPGFHIFACEAPPWAVFDTSLPRFDRLRPDTRGLPPGQTSPGADA